MISLISGLIIFSTVGRPVAQLSLKITSTTMLEGGKKVQVKLALQNASESKQTVWDPRNFEGMNSVHIEQMMKDGKWKDVTPPAPPRAGGVATSINLKPGETAGLMPIIVKLSAGPRPATIRAIYTNSLASRAPVVRVWTGRIESKPVALATR